MSLRRLIFPLLFGFISLSVAWSQTITWTATTSGDWNNSANWDLGRVPAAEDRVVFPEQERKSLITGFGPDAGNAGPVTVKQITVGGSFIFELDQNLTVTDAVDMLAGSQIIANSGVKFRIQGRFNNGDTLLPSSTASLGGTLQGPPSGDNAEFIFESDVTLGTLDARNSIIRFEGQRVQEFRSNNQILPDVVIEKTNFIALRPVIFDVIQRDGATLEIKSGRLGLGTARAVDWHLGSDTQFSGSGVEVFIGPGSIRGNRTVTVGAGARIIHRNDEATIQGDLILETGGGYGLFGVNPFPEDPVVPVTFTGNVTIEDGADISLDDRIVTIGGSLHAESGTAIADTATIVMSNSNGAATVQLNSVAPLHNLVVDMAGGLNLTSDLNLVNDFIVYRGTVDPAERSITARDVIVLGENYNPHDPDRSAWRLDGDGLREGSSSTNFLFQVPRFNDLPAGPAPEDYAGKFTDLTGATLRATRNLYVNGSDLTGTGGWFLTLPDTPSSSDVFDEPFAVVLNSTIQHGTVTNDQSWVAAAKREQSAGEFGFGVTDGGDNHGNWGFIRPEIARAMTVNDRVLYLEFSEPQRIVAPGEAIFFDGGTPIIPASRHFQGIFTLPATVTWNPGDPLDETDLVPPVAPVEYVFVRLDPDRPEWRWKTDATGGTAGSAAATDRDGNNTVDSIPAISLVKGSFVSAQSRLPLRNYGLNEHDGGAIDGFADTEDGAGPILYRVRFGRAAHTQPAATLYDGHNYLHLYWSEPVEIHGLARDGENIRSELCEGVAPATVAGHCGDIRSRGDRILVDGYLSYQRPDAPNPELMSRGSRDAELSANSLFRGDATDARVFPGDEAARSQELRIYLSGWNANAADATEAAFVGWHADAFDPARVLEPGGNVQTEPSDFIQDEQGNRVNHHLHPRWERDDTSQPHVTAANPGDSSVLFTGAGSFFNAWDVEAPEFSVFFPAVNGIPAEFESHIVDRNSSGFVDAIDIHLLDNGIISFGNAVGSGVPEAVLDDPQNMPIPGDPNDPRPLWDPVNASEADRASSLFTHPNTRPNEGIRWSSLQHARNQDAITVGPPGALLPALDVEAAVDSQPFGDIDQENDAYFRLLLPDEQFPMDQPLTLRYDEAGRVTDVAGNLLRTVEIPVRMLEVDAPEVELALVSAGGRRMFVRFSKPVFGANDGVTPISASQLRIPSGPGIMGLEIVQTSEDPRLGRGGAIEIFLNLSRGVRATELFTLNLEWVMPGTPIFDAFGNQLALPPGTRRITDIAIGAATPISAVEVPGSAGNVLGDFRVVRVFDGSEAIAATDITLQVQLAAEALRARETELLVIPSPATEGYWSLDAIPGLIAPSQVIERASRIRPFEQEERELSFLIPREDPAVQDGTSLQFQFRMDNLNVARLTDPSDPRTVAPWSLLLGKGFIEQRGNVTILNNVIYPARDDRTVLAYELVRPGMTTVTVFSLDGTLVRTLQRGRLTAGMHRAVWDGRNNSGQAVARGMYFIRVVAPGVDEFRKVMVVRDR